MNENSDAIDDILAAFSDHLERGTPLPSLDHLDLRDRQRAENLMRLMETGQLIDPSASAPSLEMLLAGTEFADALPPAAPRREAPVLHRMRDLVAEVDPRAEVRIDNEGFLCFGYLDLLVQFHPLDMDDPHLPREAIRALFDADSYVDLLALVAARTSDLLTRVVSRYEADPTISTAGNRPASPTLPVLPIALACRAMLERSAPEWGEFGLHHTVPDVIDVAELETQIATRLVAEEAKRRYQGDKALAYRGLVGHEQRLVALITTGTRPGQRFDAAAEVDRVARQVA